MDNSLQIKLQSNIFYRMNVLEQNIQTLEMKVSRLETNLKSSVFKMKSNIINFMQSGKIDTEAILKEYNYIDLSPESFQKVVQSDSVFIILDVGTVPAENSGKYKNENYFHIPFEELKEKQDLLPSKVYPTLVISPKGVKSILACETLYQSGFFAVFNVSGGHAFN